MLELKSKKSREPGRSSMSRYINISVFMTITFTLIVCGIAEASSQFYDSKVAATVISHDKVGHQVNQAKSPLSRSTTSLVVLHAVDRLSDALTRRSVVLFLVAAFATLFLASITDSRVFSFLSTLEHELTHGIIAISCGGSFHGMTVTASKGGCAEVTGNSVVRLAPYCLPLFCFSCFCLIPFLKENVRMPGVLVAGMAYGNYLKGNFTNIGIQADIRDSVGKMVAYPLIFIVNVALFSVLIVLLGKM